MMRCGIVCPYLGTRIRLLRAFSTAFWIASGTSRALPYPIPTTEFSSPTATRAVNEKRRPPLTTFATRLISITRSCRSRPWGLTVSISGFIGIATQGSGSEPQARLAGALGERPDAAMEAVAAAVEDAGLDPRRLRPLCEGLAGALCLLGRRQLAELGLGPGNRGERGAAVIVDELREHAAVGAEHGQARSLCGAADLGPHPAPAAESLLRFRQNSHRPCLGSPTADAEGSMSAELVMSYARFPTLRRTCSPA